MITIQENIIINKNSDIERLKEELQEEKEIVTKMSSDQIVDQNTNEAKHTSPIPTVYLCAQCLESQLSGNSMLKCDECDYLFCSECCLKSHMEETHTFKCNFCDTILKKEKELNRHKENKHTFPCNKCDFVGESNGCLSNHMIVKHVIGGFFEKIRNEE